jgi:hypothetical protein
MALMGLGMGALATAAVGDRISAWMERRKVMGHLC